MMLGQRFGCGRGTVANGGVPGIGLRLDTEVWQSPNGVWYAATDGTGKPAGVLRFDQSRLADDGAVDRLIKRVAAARAWTIPGVLPIVDLVEDSGRIWLITGAIPTSDTAAQTEQTLFGPPQSPSIALPDDAPTMPVPVVKDFVEEWRRRRWRRVFPILMSLIAVGLVVWAGIAVRDAARKPAVSHAALQISGINVHEEGLIAQDGFALASPAAVTPSDLCEGTVDMVATLETNGGNGTFQYEWDMTNAPPVRQSVAFTGTEVSPQDIHYTWRLILHGPARSAPPSRSSPRRCPRCRRRPPR